MRIQVNQRGGFAGGTQTLVDVESSNLEPTKTAQIERLAMELKSAIVAGQTSSQAGADFLRYDVTLQEGQHSQTLTLVDDDSSGMTHVRSLLRQLSALARGSG